MSTYIVKIDFQEGAGWEEITNYAGENLVLYRSIKKTQTLHKDYRSTIDTCNFKIESRAAIANSFLIATKNILCEVIKDGSDYFTGIIRPNTNVRINAKTDFLDFKALDNSYKLEFNLVEDIGYYGDKICDPGDTGNSIVHQLLTAAGYAGGNIGALPTISNTILAFEEKRDTATFYEILDNLIFVYGYVFYFDDEGKFQMYEWAKDDAASTDNLTTTNLLNGVDIKKEDIEFDSVFFKYLTQGAVNSTVSTHTFGNIAKSGTYISDRISFTQLSEYEEYLQKLYTDSRENKILSQFDNSTYTLTIARIDATDLIFMAPISGAGLAINDSVDNVEISAVDINDYGIKYTLDNNSATQIVFFGTISTQADYYWTSEDNEVYYPARAGAVTNPIEVKSKYAFDDAISEAFAQSLYKMKKDAVVTYIFSSEDNFDIGEYCDLTLADAGIGSAQVRIIKKITTEEFPIIRYIAEGIGTIGGITASVVTVANSNYIALSDIQESIKTVQSVLTGAGVSVPIASTNMQDLSVDVQGLYFTDTELGFFDGSDWTVHIDNTGDFLFKGDADNYVEWDGAKLSVYGDMFLSGDSEIQGSVKVGETLTVAGSINVDNKLLIDGTNNRYSVYTPELGTLKIALGYLGGIAAYNDTQYGLYIADGNVVRFEGGGELVDNDYTIKEDGSITIENGDGDTVARFGSVAAGNVGMILGFTGADMDSPSSGDGRFYADNDEWGIEQYTAGAWSTVNSIKAGGVDSNGNPVPLISCRGMTNSLADEVDVEFFPSDDFRVFDFEDNAEDQHGVDNWATKTDVAYSAIHKFETKSLVASGASTQAQLDSAAAYATGGQSQAFGTWIYINQHEAGGSFVALYNFNGLAEYISMNYAPTVDGFKAKVLLKDSTGVTTITADDNLSYAAWHYIGFVYSADDKILSLISDDTIKELDLSGRSFSILDGIVSVVAFSGTSSITYLDEVIFAPDQFVEPDVFVQHYLHDVAWNTEASVKDLFFNPAAGGYSIFKEGIKLPDLTLGSIPFIGTDGVVLEDNSDLFWDNINKRLGIGTIIPGVKVDIEDGSAVDPGHLYLTNSRANHVDNAARATWRLNTSVQERTAFDLRVGFNNVTDAVRNTLVEFKTANAGSFGTTMVIDGGNVGIGTDSPAHILHINQTTTDEGIILSSPAGGKASIRLQNGVTTKWKLHNDGTDSDKFFIQDAGGAYHFTIDQDGNVGIGTTGPAAKLQITDTSTYNPTSLILSGTEPTRYYGLIRPQSSSGITYLGLGVRSNNVDYFDTLVIRRDRVGIGTVSPNESLTLGADGVLSIDERAAAPDHTAAFGKIWVKNTSPCELWYTDDAGTDTKII